jgi:hypothetical protein
MVVVLDRDGADAASELFAKNGETVVRLGEVTASPSGPAVSYRGHLDLAWRTP